MAEDIPYFDEQDVQSLLSGGNFGGLTKLLPLIFQQMSGLPVTLPGTIPEAGGYNYFDNYKAMLSLRDNARSYSEARGLDSLSQEATISTIAQRMAATLGRPLSQEQMGSIRWAAGILSTYGPQYIGIAKKVLQQGGVSEDGNDQAINAMLSTAEQLLDATYGIAGSRLPFYSVAKSSFGNDVPTQEQDAILNEVVHRLFPVDADLKVTGGLNARETAGVLQHLNRMGINPLNTNTYAMQSLIKENAQAGLGNLSNAENVRLIETLSSSKISNVLSSGGRLEAKKTWIDQQSKANTKMSRDTAREYANQIEKADRLTAQLHNLNLGVKDNLATASAERLDQIGIDIAKQSARWAKQLGQETDEDRKKELQARVNYYNQLQKEFTQFQQASSAYQAAGGKVGNFNQQIEALQTEAVTTTVANNFKDLTEEERKTLSNAEILRDRLVTDKIDVALLESTREEDQERRSQYLKDLRQDANISQATLRDIKAYTETKDKSGTTLLERSQAVRAKMSKSLEAGIAADANRIIREYGEVLATGDKDKIAEFENAKENKEVIREFKGILAARNTENVLGANARSASRLFDAVMATGGGSIGGQAIQNVGQMSTAMDMITQMVGRYQMKDDQWENYWTRMAYGMTQSDTNINEVLQMSKIAADAAVQSGGDRGVAAMAATELGMAAKATARRMGYNPDQLATTVSQAAGVASNSITARMIGALGYSLQGADFAKIKERFKGDQYALDILRKIQNREALSSDEVHYIHENGYQMLTDLGISGDRQRSLLNSSLYGELGAYATKGATTYTLDDRTNKNIREGIIGTLLNKVGISGEQASKISTTAYSVLAKNPELYNDPQKLKLAIMAQMKEEGYTANEIEKIKAIPADQLGTAVRGAATRVADRSYDGDLNKSLAAYNASKELAATEQELQNAGEIAALLPKQTHSSIQAVLKAFKDPNSNLSDIVKAAMGGNHLKKEEVTDISSKIALMGLATGNQDILRGSEMADINTAKSTFNRLVREMGGDAKATGEALLNRQNILQKINSVQDVKQREKLLQILDKPDKDKKDMAALRALGIKESELKLLQKYDKATKEIASTEEGKEDLKTMNAVLEKGAETTEEIINQNQKPTTVEARTAGPEAPKVSSPKAADDKKDVKPGEQGQTEGATDTKKVPLNTSGADAGQPTDAAKGEGSDAQSAEAAGRTFGTVTVGGKSGNSPGDAIYVYAVNIKDEPKGSPG